MKDARQSLRLVRPRASAQGKLPPPPPPSILPVYEQFKASGLTTVFREFQGQQEEHNRRMAAWFAQQQQQETGGTTTTTTPETPTTAPGLTLAEVQTLVSSAVSSAVAESTRAIPGVAALRAVTLHPNHTVRYLSYLNNPGDGQGGSFIFNDQDTHDDDAVDYVRPNDVRRTNPGRWVRTVNA